MIDYLINHNNNDNNINIWFMMIKKLSVVSSFLIQLQMVIPQSELETLIFFSIFL